MSTLERFKELDSLRGLAALVVFSYHCIFLMAVYPRWVSHLIDSPVGLLFYGGHQAVILFFLLSGFVLYLPYARAGRRPTYAVFVIKRICRIYLPYLAAVVFFALVYRLFFRVSEPTGLSALYQWRVLSLSQQLRLLRDHILFIGFFHREYWNGATWTLAEEMRISLIFPLLAALVSSLRSRNSLLCAFAGSAAVSFTIYFVHHRTPFEPFHYASLFIFGAVLAANRQLLLSSWQRLGRSGQLVTVGFALYIASYSLKWMGQYPRFISEELADWLIALSVSVFLIAALADTWFSRLLRLNWMQHLGRTSYGIYLLHLPILFAFSNLLWNRLPAGAVFVLSLVTTLVLGHFFHVFIEQPSMALGRHLACIFAPGWKPPPSQQRSVTPPLSDAETTPA